MDDDLTLRVEQAALGAMIADRRLAARLTYLEPEDFTDPRHLYVFRAVRQLSAAPQRAPGTWSGQIAKTAGRWVTSKYLEDLADACPNPAHGPAYGAMLVQATVYRQARDHADQMDTQAAMLRTESVRLTEASALGARQAAGFATLLAQVARAIRGHTAALAPATTSPASGPDPGAVPAEPASALPVEQREELVLSAVLRQHPQSRQILDYLPAAAFTSPARQEIFRAARRLNQDGRPVDELTVRWELATRSAVTAVLSPDSTRQPQVPDRYIGRLASTGIAAGESPLRTAHKLDAQLRYRTSRGHRPPAGPAENHGHAQDAPAPTAAAPLTRPQNAAETRPAGPDHTR